MGELIRYEDIQNLAQHFAKSGLFQDAKDVSKAVVKMWMANDLGEGPSFGMQHINVIQGKLAMDASGISCRIKQSPRYKYKIKMHTEQSCMIEFWEKIGGKWESPGPASTFTMDDARKADLAKGVNWKKYPKAMLFARAISQGARWYCPDIFSGSVYTPDELGGDTLQVVDSTTGEVVVECREPEQTPAFVPDCTVSSEDGLDSGTTFVETVEAPEAGPSAPSFDSVVLEFGKYKGQAIDVVYRADRSYLSWLLSKYLPERIEKQTNETYKARDIELMDAIESLMERQAVAESNMEVAGELPSNFGDAMAEVFPEGRN